jgi:hypothetical protein
MDIGSGFETNEPRKRQPFPLKVWEEPTIMRDFEVNFTISGVVQVQAEDEADAIRRAEMMNHDLLVERLDSAGRMLSLAIEVDVGGQG